MTDEADNFQRILAGAQELAATAAADRKAADEALAAARYERGQIADAIRPR